MCGKHVWNENSTLENFRVKIFVLKNFRVKILVLENFGVKILKAKNIKKGNFRQYKIFTPIFITKKRLLQIRSPTSDFQLQTKIQPQNILKNVSHLTLFIICRQSTKYQHSTNE
jgi:hypothetical protein